MHYVQWDSCTSNIQNSNIAYNTMMFSEGNIAYFASSDGNSGDQKETSEVTVYVYSTCRAPSESLIQRLLASKGCRASGLNC